jgi:hypothetical protein
MKKPAWAMSARTGPVRTFIKMKIFACEGMVCIVDERQGKDDDFTVVAPSELMLRLKELNRPYRNRNKAEMTPWQRQEHNELQNASNNCEECVKEARYMGDPTDPLVQAFWAKQRRNVTMSFAPKTDSAGYPKLPPLPLGQFTGRTTNVDSLPIIHPPPRKKTDSRLILP